MSAHRDVGMASGGPDSPGARRVGAGAVALAVVALFFAYVVNNDPTSDVVGWIIASLIAATVAAGLFLWLIPRADAAPGGANQPATTGLVCGVIALLSVVVFWLGLPYVIGTAAVLLGRIGQARAPHAGQGGLAMAAIVLGALAIAVSLVITVVDAAF